MSRNWRIYSLYKLSPTAISIFYEAYEGQFPNMEGNILFTMDGFWFFTNCSHEDKESDSQPLTHIP
jgi:hypothetical protein